MKCIRRKKMKGLKKRVAALAAAAALAVSGVTGCGTVNADKVIAKVDDTEITMGLLNFYVRYQQGVYETNYAQMMGGIDAMWSAEVGEGKTYEQSMKETSIELLKQMCVLEDHMDEYEITLTEEEKAKIKQAAEDFVKANKEEELEAISGDAETVERLLTLMTEQKKMHDAITAKADMEVSDDEARRKGMQYVLFSFTKTKDDGTTETMTVEEKKELKKEAEAFLNACKGANFAIEDITTRPLKKTPPAPFTTSTLQQEAARKLGYTVAQTMMIAQRLYESGFITYMRTDSVNLSEFATIGSKDAIIKMMGERYVHPRHFETKTKGAQEAHEAIRPTYMENQSIEGTAQEKKLYDLIWKRTIASQMADAELEKTTVTISISSSSEVFTAIGEVIKFDGFLRVYRESYDDENEQEDESNLLPPLKKGQKLEHGPIVATERFTQRPPRYTEASLVRKLEELGIGRPSTYAPTISTIQNREYVEKGNKDGEERMFNVLTLKDQQVKDENHTEITGTEKAKLFPTDTGTVVNDFLTEYFPDILDYNFTASVEKEFDEIAEGEVKWTSILKTFYDQFHPSVENTLAIKTEHKVGERILGEEPETGKPVSVKIGRFGPMAQIGTAEDEEKPRFAQMKKGQSIETITLEEVLELFKLPRTLGEYEGKTVSVGIGRFGPYVLHNKVYVSLPKTMDPMEITLEEAEQLILEKRTKEAERHIKKFAEEPELEILNGRYGPYIAYKGNNYKIPKDIVPQDLSLHSCMELIRIQDEKGVTSAPKKKFAKKK